ncbi:MAG: hypothetical protein A2X77_04275 [Gammaproteobacteria bacterium GWE2_42_36]|nr:MAG: hypothetical protein A2X77_04275 [Gammaproteobacteria bacterium GWE2_42_36]HCU05030.1 hypothetical protein [Coxiellaceae bacterium]
MRIYFGALLLLVMGIGGCNQNSNQYLFSHPRRFHQLLMQCAQLPFNQAAGDEHCRLAAFYMHSLIETVGGDKLMYNPQAFGGDILQAEMAEGKLQIQVDELMQEIVQKPQDAHLLDQLHLAEQALQQQQQKIEIMTRLAAINEGM